MKSYLELCQLKTFEERFDYLKLNGILCNETFGHDRYLNQMLYNSSEWKRTRRNVIIRDNGCDLAIDDRPIKSKIYIHHINPITVEDVIERDLKIFDMNNLISVCYDTHQAIHYGNTSRLIPSEPNQRTKGDTKLW